ncbi:MAG: hypothetical protein K0R72_1023 [Clostridia bacterium]|jgi:hypothetical protein|nr:hypothetical protein [Clostridia bacterium]
MAKLEFMSQLTIYKKALKHCVWGFLYFIVLHFDSCKLSLISNYTYFVYYEYAK